MIIHTYNGDEVIIKSFEGGAYTCAHVLAIYHEIRRGKELELNYDQLLIFHAAPPPIWNSEDIHL